MLKTKTACSVALEHVIEMTRKKNLLCKRAKKKEQLGKPKSLEVHML